LILVKLEQSQVNILDLSFACLHIPGNSHQLRQHLAIEGKYVKQAGYIKEKGNWCQAPDTGYSLQ